MAPAQQVLVRMLKIASHSIRISFLGLFFAFAFFVKFRRWVREITVDPGAQENRLCFC